MKHVLFAAALLTLPCAHAFAAVKPTEAQAPNLPPIWQAAGPRERLKALKVAEIDADRLLTERIFSIQVDSTSTVGDLALENDEITGAVRGVLVGSVNIGEPEYLEDGQVQVVRGVKIREVTETLERITHRKIEAGVERILSDRTTKNRAVSEKMIDVMGNGAIPGSPGHAKILSKRAAEADAYRRLAGRMMGLKIQGETTVRDFCLQNDKVSTALSHVLKAATPTAIRYESDGICYVTMEVKVAEIVRTTRRFMTGGNVQRTEIKDAVETKTFSETGMGAPRPAKSEGGSEGVVETQTLIREVIQSTPVLQ